MADSDEEAVTAVSAPVLSPVTAVARFDKSVLMPLRAVAWVCRVVWSCCQTVNWPLCAAWISETTSFTSMPFPLSKLAVLKLIPTFVFSFASGVWGGSHSAQFSRLLEFLSDASFDIQFLGAGDLHDDTTSGVEILNDYLVLNVRILMHFDDIDGQFVG